MQSAQIPGKQLKDVRPSQLSRKEAKTDRFQWDRRQLSCVRACACVCVRVCVRACVRMGMAIVLVCLRVSCGAPPRPPALDPPLSCEKLS